MGIPGSIGKGGMGVGNWGGLNLNLGSLNGLDSGNNMVGIGETSITEWGSIPVVGGGVDHGGYLTDGVNETILVIIFRITLKGNGPISPLGGNKTTNSCMHRSGSRSGGQKRLTTGQSEDSRQANENFHDDVMRRSSKIV